MLDALIVGGGFYGAAIAAYLVRRRGFANVAVIEREAELLARASYANQARIHNGYHYPRSYTTAHRSRVNLPRFVADFPQAVNSDFTKLYAISARNSKVTARQFARFCRDIGAVLEPAPPELAGLFNDRLIEAVFRVQEYAFDATALRRWAEQELEACAVAVHRRTRVASVQVPPDTSEIRAECVGADGSRQELVTRYLFNCTYSGLNQLDGDLGVTETTLKHEITELALVEVPQELAGVGVTVMDGPFFSVMPFPARGLHSLSHVRYTPHLSWPDSPGADPYSRLDVYARDTRVDRMVRDASRYLPALREVRPVDSLFEVKTVLVKNEGDDGRPILFERYGKVPGAYAILGGKIDNLYDVLARLDREVLPLDSGS